MVVALAVTTPLAPHVLQLHRQDMLLLTLAAVAVQVAIILRGLLVWRPQIARAMLSFRVVVAAQVATIHQVRVVRPTDLTQFNHVQEAIRAERASSVIS